MGESMLEGGFRYLKSMGHHPECESELMPEGSCTCGRESAFYMLQELLKTGDNHIVVITEDGWVVEHSIQCRLDGMMGNCYATENMVLFAGTILRAFKPGRYIAKMGKLGLSSESFDLRREDGKACEYRGVASLEAKRKVKDDPKA